jgi:hypothetical protein
MGIKYIFVKVDVELATKSTPHALQANSTTLLILVIERTMTQQRATKHRQQQVKDIVSSHFSRTDFWL